MERVSGTGYKNYITAFKQKRINPLDNLVVKNNRTLESYYVEDNGELDWANVFNRKKAETMTTRQILFRKKWYIRVGKNFLNDEEVDFID